MLNTKPNVTTNHTMVTIAPVHDHTGHQECEYTNQTHAIVQFSILNKQKRGLCCFISSKISSK